MIDDYFNSIIPKKAKEIIGWYKNSIQPCDDLTYDDVEHMNRNFDLVIEYAVQSSHYIEHWKVVPTEDIADSIADQAESFQGNLKTLLTDLAGELWAVCGSRLKKQNKKVSYNFLPLQIPTWHEHRG